MPKPPNLEEPPDFSLVQGGPLFQLYRRAHLSGDALELLRRRVLVITCVAWVPLFLLSAFTGQAVGGASKIPFLYDVEAHVRFLIALPILIWAEVIIHLRIRLVVQQFVERRIILCQEMQKFHNIIISTMRVRNSLILEVALLVGIYTIGLWVWRTQIAYGTPSWYAIPEAKQLHLTPAGYWYVLVSIPIFQFILLRWCLRFLLWFSFLWRVSRLNLQLIPIHPDRAAGIGFLGQSMYAFGPLLFTQGALLAGLIAGQIFYKGQSMAAFKVEIAVTLIFFVLIMLSPLTMFTAHLIKAKRQALIDFGRLSSRYAKEFEEKWFHGSGPTKSELLGSADIQSLTDLGTSYKIVQEMRLVPFSWKDVTMLAAFAVLPLLPLTLTSFSLEEILDHLIQVLF